MYAYKFIVIDIELYIWYVDDSLICASVPCSWAPVSLRDCIVTFVNFLHVLGISRAADNSQYYQKWSTNSNPNIILVVYNKIS